LAGIARYLFREMQQLFELRINWSSSIIAHQCSRQISIVEFFTEKLSVRGGSIEAVVRS
jgi:hypothetical protein